MRNGWPHAAAICAPVARNGGGRMYLSEYEGHLEM